MSQARVWLITGASSGFGRELSKIVLENGEMVVAAARRTHLLDDLVAQYSAERILVVKTDVTQPQDVSDCFARALGVFGHIDVVFNNAGFADVGEVESMQDAQARGIMETNFWGAVSVTREAVKCFRESNPEGAGGRLLQMSSMYGVAGTPCGAFYTASKHALEGLTKCLVKELDPAWNIKVTILEPGYFDCEINANTQWSPPHPAYSNPTLPGTRKRAEWDSFVAKGDAVKAAELFYRAAALPDPPLQFPVGKDAVEMTREMLDGLGKTVALYESWSDDLERTSA